MKQNFGFKQSKAHPTNIRLRLKKKEEVNTDEALKVEKITTRVDYSSLYKKFKEKLNAMKEEEVKSLFDYLEATDERPKLSVCCNMVVYLVSCDTHSVVMYVRDSHNIDEILKNPPFCFIENLEIEERGTFDIKEAKDEWLDDNYNVVAYFEPYEPVMWRQECGDRFQVRLQTKEELLRQYLKSIE